MAKKKQKPAAKAKKVAKTKPAAKGAKPKPAAKVAKTKPAAKAAKVAKKKVARLQKPRNIAELQSFLETLPDAKTKPAAKGTKAVKGGAFRVDVDLQNDTTGILFTTPALRGCGIPPNDEEAWAELVASGQLLPVELVGSASVFVRVVVGALTAEEDRAWVGRVVAPLSLPEGRLVMSGGRWYVDGEEWEREERERDYSRAIDVPAGEYRATLLSTIHGVNGELLLERAGGAEQLGTWWRRTRGEGARFPAWLASRCRDDPRHDPGHWDDWTEGEGAEAPDEEPELVDLVLHLEPRGDARVPAPALEAGFVSFDAWEVRRPDFAPGDLVAKDPVRAPEQEARCEEPAEWPTVDALALMATSPLAPLAGGPVEHPLADLVGVYRVAWLAANGPTPELRIELPRGATFVPAGGRLEGVTFEPAPGRLRVGFTGAAARWFTLNALSEVQERLAGLPDGSVLELLTAPFEIEGMGGGEDEGGVGLQRYRGAVRGGTWSITETFPALEAAVLRDALALSAETARDRSLEVRTKDELEAVLTQARREDFLYAQDPIRLQGQKVNLKKWTPAGLPERLEAGTTLTVKAEERLAYFLAAPLFRARFGASWRCTSPQDEEDDDEDEAADAALDEALSALQRKVDEAARRMAEGSPVVLEGKAGSFAKVDVRAQRPLDADFVDRCEQQLARLGYRYVGDIVCSRVPEVIISGWARPESDTWAALLTAIMQSRFELVTELRDGAGLTTALGGHVEDEPEKRQFRTACPDVDFNRLKKLHERHEARRKQLLPAEGPAVTVTADLAALARAVDRSLVRQLAD